MDLVTSQNLIATFFFLGLSSLPMTAPGSSTCGGGAGGGALEDILSATLLDVVLDCPRTFVEVKGSRGSSLEAELLVGVLFRGSTMGRVEGRFESLESGEGPCALVRAQERMRSRDVLESGEVFFIDVVFNTQRHNVLG